MSASAGSGITFDVRRSDRPVPEDVRARVLEAPGFGQSFTDHMVTIRWSADRGWHDGRLEPYGPLVLDPATSVFHYGQEIFEGLKAYRHEAGQIMLFRPQANAARFRRSARRMAMPELPDEAFVEALELLINHDRDWCPGGAEQSLYLRPFMIATTPTLGVHQPAQSYLFVLIASPAGHFFSGGISQVSVWLTDAYTRAAPGGTGEAKCGGNYGAAFVGQLQAIAHGCDQVVWLDAVERRWVEEMGGMNLFFVYGSRSRVRIMTPALTGTLLPGLTRDSVLRLAPDLGFAASEGRISVEDWMAGSDAGEITEVFACGTAAVITPVGEVKSAAGDWTIGDGKPGPVTMRLRDELVGIQYGRLPDPYGWMHKVI